MHATVQPHAPRDPRCWVLIDLESAVVDDTAHRAYQAMERWDPDGPGRSRRGYRPEEDPCATPRWVFQTVLAASVMWLVEHVDGGLDVARFATFSAPELDERGVVAGVLEMLGDAPRGAELCSFGGCAHDGPLLAVAACRQGLTLPERWCWLALNPGDPRRHLDIHRSVTGGLKMKPIHMTELAAALGLPAKLTAPPFSIAALAKAGRWAEVQEACEGDVITLALLAARWSKLLDPRADPDAAEDRILRRVVELRPDRGYTAELAARRQRRFVDQIRRAAAEAARLAPWLDDAAGRHDLRHAAAGKVMRHPPPGE